MLPPSEISLSIVLPAFNEGANLGATLVGAIASAVDLEIPWEIIIVDDGSWDETQEICEAYTRKYPLNLRVIRHNSNQGYGAALQSGFNAASKTLVFFTDADGQFQFDHLREFIDLIRDNEIVIGFRQKRMDPWFRKLNSRVGNLLAHVMLDVHVRDINCAYKLFRADLLKALPLKSAGALINTEILAFAASKNWKITELPVRHYPRKFGEPTGAKLRVIAKTFSEYFRLRKHIQFSGREVSCDKTATLVD